MSKRRIYKPSEVKLTQSRMYDILREPVITEKTTMASEHNQVTFKVPLEASKPEIRHAVERLFDVKVKAVNTLRHKGKRKRFRGIQGRRSDEKKAYVTLHEGYSIDVTTGI
jgi:large subunit ribosomal protein L23